MSVWLTIPSARPPAECGPILAKWRERGYKIALLRDYVDQSVDVDLCYFSAPAFNGYPGYAASVNYLIREVIEEDPAAEWFIAAGDDIEPDPHLTADKIAAELGFHFRRERYSGRPWGEEPGTFGVMQPTGDRWGEDGWSRTKWPDAPAMIDRICGSAWIGREFARRMYGGRGPLFDGYRHMFVDEELQNVATKMGVLWQRRDLTQYHYHWMREPGKTERDCPEFLKPVSVGEAGRKHWAESAALFKSRQAAGFPGHEPIA